MTDKSKIIEQAYGSEDIRQEYSAVVGYHSFLVNSRFTIAGLYVAAIGFLAGAVLANDTTWITRACGSALASWITLSLWIIELKSRALLTNVAHRGIDIEHQYWDLVNNKWYDGFFSRQYKEPPKHDYENDKAARYMEPDRPIFGWFKKPISHKFAKYISHSMGLDLLYAGSGVFWLCFLVTSVVCILTGE